MRVAPCFFLTLPLLSCERGEPPGPAEAVEASVPFRLELLEVTPCPPPPGFDTQKTQLLGVRVRLESAHPGGVPANYFYGSLVASDRSRYLAELPGCAPVLSGPPLYPGEKAEGFLNFPVPVGKTLDSVVYAPRLGGVSSPEIQLALALGPSPAAPPAEEEE